jgi:Kef-type K+ transport system membrane component KefB
MRRFSGQPILFVLGMAVALAGVSEMLHTEVLLMALAAGFFVENVSHVEAEPFIHAVEANSVPFYALFFALAGAGIHLDALTEVWYLVLILVAVRAAAFWFGTRLGARVGQAPDTVQKYAWTGFISQAGVTLGMVTIAAEAFPAWGEEMKLLIVAMVAVHELVGPVILQKGLEASGETQQAVWPEDAEDRKAKAATAAA